MRKTFIIGIIIITLASVFFWWKEDRQDIRKIFKEQKVEVVIDDSREDNTKASKERADFPAVENKKEVVVEEKKPEKILDKILIDVPFSTQAPLGKWDAFHEEACEETSLLMVKYYLDKKGLNPEIAEKEIQALIAYQINKYGKYEDSTAKELVDLAKDYYGIKNLKVIYDFSKEDLKTYLSLGRPIIVPAAGRLLGNPNFKSPGPLYHNLVLVGFSGNTIVTNDPGTRKGQGYQYDIDVLYNAIHDFPGDLKNMEKGRKAMIIVE